MDLVNRAKDYATFKHEACHCQFIFCYSYKQ